MLQNLKIVSYSQYLDLTAEMPTD